MKSTSPSPTLSQKFHRLRAIRRLALAGCCLMAVACATASVTTPVRAIREATGSNSAAIQATVDAFRADLGAPNNGNSVGSQATGRREITWDGGDNDAAPARLPADFFNAIAPRGLILSGDPRIQFQVSADTTNTTGTADEFGNVNATYPTAFSAFSAPRLFAALNSPAIELNFVVPGSLVPAVVSGFGAVFTDVDVSGPTRIRFFDAEGVLIFERAVLATPGDGSLSFLGVVFQSPCIAKVQIIAGEAALGPNDVTQTTGNPDIVALDDFIYSEPQSIGSRVAISAASRAPRATIFDGSTGATLVGVEPFEGRKARRGVSVAVGDVNGDGVADLVTGAGPLSEPRVRVFDGDTSMVLHDFLAYDERFRGGVNVAVGNINGDGFLDIITSPGRGGHVKVFSGANPNVVFGAFDAYDGRVAGGVRLAVADIDGDFIDDIITAPGRTMEARVRVFSGATISATSPSLVADFIAAPGRRGIFVAAGDVNGDGVPDYVIGPDAGSAPEVRVLDGLTFEPLENLLGSFHAFSPRFRGGVRVAVGDVNGNGTLDVITASGKGSITTVRAFDPGGDSTGPFFNCLPFGPRDRSGAFVSAIRR